MILCLAALFALSSSRKKADPSKSPLTGTRIAREEGVQLEFAANSISFRCF